MLLHPSGTAKHIFHCQYLWGFPSLRWRAFRNLPINLFPVKWPLGNVFNTMYQMFLLFVPQGRFLVPGDYNNLNLPFHSVFTVMLCRNRACAQCMITRSMWVWCTLWKGLLVSFGHCTFAPSLPFNCFNLILKIYWRWPLSISLHTLLVHLSMWQKHLVLHMKCQNI